MVVATCDTVAVVTYYYARRHLKHNLRLVVLFLPRALQPNVLRGQVVHGNTALQFVLACDALAAIIPATVRLLWLQLLLPLQVCHLVPPASHPFGPVRPNKVQGQP